MKPFLFALFVLALGGVVPVAAQTPSLIPTVAVAGGVFQQGKRTLDPANPGRTVTVSAFLLGETVVTQDQYQAVTGSNPSRFKGPLNPVERVSWYDAVAFCNALSLKEGLAPAYTIDGTSVKWDPSSPGWRLPTEAEFEFAARGGAKSQGYSFPGADSAEGVAWGYFNASHRTHVVKELPPNELGLYGMAGNVWQWCWDWYEFDRSALPSTDPRGPDTGSDKVNRGGGWNSDYVDAFRPYYRADDGPDSKEADLGFRVARNAPVSTSLPAASPTGG
jgi:formylglycine-generating enzyme required for sulfatase activity